MAQSAFFKPLTEADRTSSRTLLHEAIPITGSLLSGSDAAGGGSFAYGIRASDGRPENIKAYSHGMFQSVYDYPYLSSSANHLMDITVGVSPVVPHTGSDYQADYSGPLEMISHVKVQKDKKRNIYSQMAQILNGFDTGSAVRLFDADGDYSGTTTDAILDPIFISFSRLLVKDEIKKGSFSLSLGTHQQVATAFSKKLVIADTGAENNYRINSPAGEYGILKASGDIHSSFGSSTSCGLVFYQAGIAILDGSKVFRKKNEPDATGSVDAGQADKDGILEQADEPIMTTTNQTASLNGVSVSSPLYSQVLMSGTIDQMADAVRSRVEKISFNNTTELNSTIYFCRANHNEFNYSSNPTYLSGSQIIVKNNNVLQPPRSYVTTVGLYSADNELLAVAKLSEPLRKDPTNELTLRVRLDY